MSAIRHLEIILKTVERCNINCTYCYFFNGLDQSYLKHPPYISKEIIKNTANFLKNGCKNLGVKSVRIDYHGGEPLMQKQNDFDHMCKTFKEELEPVTELSFAVQTNAMLINENWIELFHRHNVAVGVSLDGPKEYNDKYRLDKRGRSTYDKSVEGIRLLNKYAKENYILQPGILCVINPECCPKKTYHHFVNDLGFNNIDFLIPDLTRDAVYGLNIDTSEYGNFLSLLFDEWIKDDNPAIRIRILNSLLSLFAGGAASIHGMDDVSDFSAFTIASNGDLAPDDTLRSCDPNLMNLGLNVKNNSLHDFLSHPLFNLLTNSQSQVPDECLQCEWVKACRGGALVNRYSQSELFTRKSSMCEALKIIYKEIQKFLIKYEIESIIN